ncbi:MAG: IS3 family transposase [Ruminiclostridium sp.]|nr:IS3 family transposase [Ruminiclostridium sp.]
MNIKYTFEEKFNAVNRIKNGEKVETLSSELGISEKTLLDWCDKYRLVKGSTEITISQYNDLLRVVEKQKQMLEVLQTVDCNVHSPLQEKLCELEELQNKYSVRVICDALKVPRGTFYNHIKRNKRGNSLEAKRKEKLAEDIKRIYEDNNQIFGAAKITALLKQEGIIVSEKYVRKIMNEMELKSVRTDSKKNYVKNKKRTNVIKQNFTAEKPDAVWVSDVTAFRIKEKWYYVCVILDLYSRKVVAHKVSRSNSTHLCKITFKNAWEDRKPNAGLIFHSDNGSNYVSNAFCSYLESKGVIRSYSKSRTPHDNAVAESFFASLKREEIYRREFSSEKDFERTVVRYIEFYNSRRPHSSIDYKTPNKYEEIYYNEMNPAG